MDVVAGGWRIAANLVILVDVPVLDGSELPAGSSRGVAAVEALNDSKGHKLFILW
jgi:hypothetical protein